MGAVDAIRALAIMSCVGIGYGTMMNKCMKVLANEEFRTACSELDSNHIKPCLVKTQQDADVLVGAKIIGGRAAIPRNNICAARKEIMDADCISLHVRSDPQQAWQWTEWRTGSSSMIRNFAITEGSTTYTCPYEERVLAFYTDCLAAYNAGKHESGVYTISPDGKTVLTAYCEQELDGGGWMVFQQRSDGSENFYRNWEDYKLGFGNPGGEFWIGNENLHQLTKNRDVTLMIQLGNEAGTKKEVKYTTFSVESEAMKYRLQVSGYQGATPPGDSFSEHHGMYFTTYDRDNDNRGDGNCAVAFHGAYWYNRCHHSNLNGLYGSTEYGIGINWAHWTGHDYSFPFVRMMLKIHPER